MNDVKNHQNDNLIKFQGYVFDKSATSHCRDKSVVFWPRLSLGLLWLSTGRLSEPQNHKRFLNTELSFWELSLEIG